MTTRIALEAKKPAFASDFSFCLTSLWQDGSNAHAGKSLSEFAFSPGDLATLARSDALAFLPPATINDPVTGQITSTIAVGGEQDGYNFGMVAGQTIIFSVRGSGATQLRDPVFAILSDPQRDGSYELTRIDDDGGDGLNSLLTYTAAYTGNHILVVLAAGASQTGQYTLQVVPQNATDEPDTFAGAVNLSVGGIYYGFIDFVPPVGERIYGDRFGEVDTFKVTLEAGKAYIIETSGGTDYLSNYQSLPPGEVDTIMVIYGPDGSVVFNDDASFANGDIGSAVAYIAPASGTYFIDVTAYAPQLGGYSITVKEVDLTGKDPLEALYWDNANNLAPNSGTNVVKVYFAVPGENFGESDDGTTPLPSYGWNALEKQQVLDALQEYSKVLGFTYVEATNAAEADFRLITTTSSQYGAYFYPQDPAFGDAQGIGAFNVNSGGWDKPGVSTQDIPGDQVSLTQGGYAFAVILHEFGHAHGLAHPHDNGGGSEVLSGVFGPFDSYGFYDLNQGVYTVMSYNDAWPLHPDGPSPFTISGIDDGWSGTLSAFDIAALQERYNVRPDYATGNSIYQLKDVQAQGTYYETIYDTGGVDEIRYDGLLDAQIDLIAATLDYSATGGGVLSFVDGIKGGYTIANGVVIENASGGDGNDVLLGNAAANVLRGNNGRDALLGRDGDDTLDGGNDVDALDGGDGDDLLIGANGDDLLLGGEGNDNLNGGNGNDTLNGGEGNDNLNGGRGRDVFAFEDNSGNDLIADFARGDDKINLSAIDADTNSDGQQGFAWIGDGAFSGTAGELRSYRENGTNYLAGDVDGDGVADFVIQTHVQIIQSDIIFA